MAATRTNAVSYLHASETAIEVGTEISARGQAANFLDSPLEDLLESVRPGGKPCRSSSVFLARDMDTLESMGRGDDLIHLAEPVGEVHAFDAGWLERATTLFHESRGRPDEKQTRAIRSCVSAYWSGRRLPDGAEESSHLEYLVPAAKIVGLCYEPSPGAGHDGPAGPVR